MKEEATVTNLRMSVTQLPLVPWLTVSRKQEHYSLSPKVHTVNVSNSLPTEKPALTICSEAWSYCRSSKSDSREFNKYDDECLVLLKWLLLFSFKKTQMHWFVLISGFKESNTVKERSCKAVALTLAPLCLLLLTGLIFFFFMCKHIIIVIVLFSTETLNKTITLSVCLVFICHRHQRQLKLGNEDVAITDQPDWKNPSTTD